MSDGATIEQILTVQNDGETTETYTVKFFKGTNEESDKIFEHSYTLDPKMYTVVRLNVNASELGIGNKELLYEIHASGGGIKAGGATIKVVPSDTRAAPIINSTFLDPLSFRTGLYPAQRPIVKQDVIDKVNAMDMAGIKTIIITYVEYITIGRGAFYPSSIPELLSQPSALDFDFVGTVMKQAELNGQKIILGIGRGNDPELTYNGCTDVNRLAKAMTLASKVIEELFTLYGANPCFYGWYITHETGNIDYAKPYYNYIADLCHSLTPDKPVVISPDGNASASQSIINASNCDIFIYQDAVGAGYVPFEYTWNPQNRINMLPGLFANYASWHSNPSKHIWANVEVFQMDGPTYANAYSAEWSRVLQQINIEKNYVSNICMYDFGGFMETSESTAQLGGPKAVKLYNDYQEYRATF
ncbi:DUF4434 domain-containing protein [Cohnella herbarum]|uniref:DUF4434 domain-containing protein n=1 Tax=Cohnella herbarum TaxID=2728023 RepID=A0A7Z2ZJ34_9BACL|nr:DUF4434 domain-containing protein [Cohnella herbarum]QJD81726.1 DUF4434 domain-containing protein [Cohnella herbarum]